MARCGACSADFPDEFRFCGACGMPTSPAADRPRTVRKTVTVLFADIVGSTELGERLDPETTRALMTRYFAVMKRILERHGGTVEKFIGDAVMAVFGIPALHEDDALRAVRAAVEMRTTLAALDADLKAELGVSIQVRIGVDTGVVVAGDPASGQTLVTGNAVNVAARLEGAAGPGDIYLGATTYRLTRDAVTADALEPLALKGKSELVRAWRLQWVARQGAGVERRHTGRLVGRERELGRLRQAWEVVVRDRRCRLVTVVGPAGIGKTRLVAELGAEISASGRMLRGRCIAYGDGATFWPLREMVLAATGATEDDPADTVQSRLVAILGSLPDADAVAYHVGQAIGTLDDGVGRQDLFHGIRRFIEALTDAGPLIAVWDDVHRAEPMLLDLLAELTRSVEAPVLLVCLARDGLPDDGPTRRPAGDDAGTLHLEPLTPEASGELLAGLLDGHHLPLPLAERLTATAEGDPLFLTEMVAMLIEDGRIRQVDGGWEFDSDLAEVLVPATVRALVEARLDGLGPVERRVVELASVVGRSFRPDQVVALDDGDGPSIDHSTVPAVLNRLAGLEIIRVDHRAAGPAIFRFRTALLRDAAHEAMEKDRRAVLHERHAMWVVDQHEGRADGMEAIVAAHLEEAARYRYELGGQAGELARLQAEAGLWLARAGSAAVRRHDAHAASSLLERATRLLPHGSAERLAATLVLAEARRQSGDLSTCRALLQTVTTEAAEAGLTTLKARAAILLTWLDGSAGAVDLPVAVEDLGERVEAQLELAGDDESLSLLWGLRLDAAMEEGLMRKAARAATAVIRHAEAVDDPWLVARRAHAMLVEIALVGATPVAEAIALSTATLDAIGHERRLESALAAIRGRLRAMSDDLQGAREDVLVARSIAADLDLFYPRIYAEEAGAEVEDAAGDLSGALDALDRAACLADGAGDPATSERIATTRAAVLIRHGRIEEASAALDATVELGSGAVWTRVRRNGVRAVLAAARGDADAARDLAASVVALAGTTDALLWQAEAQAWAGIALATAGDAGARSHLDAARQMWLSKGATRLAAMLPIADTAAPEGRVRHRSVARSGGVVPHGAGPRRIDVREGDDLLGALAIAGIERPRPVLILVGGADGLADGLAQSLHPIFGDVLPSVARELDAVVVDGGSDTGVMRAIGRGWRERGCRQPLIGVMAAGTVRDGPLADGDASEVARDRESTAAPERNHTHLVVVPGATWGDERAWMRAVAAVISGERGRAMLLVDGGPLARREALEGVAAGIPLLVLRGSGRAADELAPSDGGSSVGADTVRGGHEGRIRAIDARAPGDLRAALRDLLAEGLEGSRG